MMFMPHAKQRTRTIQVRGPARSASMSKSSRRSSLAARPGTACRFSAGGAPSCSAACADGRGLEFKAYSSGSHCWG
jgi:hypothetical protein